MVVPVSQILPAFDIFNPAKNAAFAVQFMTAWVALFEVYRMRATDRVLIQAAAGGIGTATVQMAKALGCEVFGTASKDIKLDLIRKLGANHPTNYHTDDFVKFIREKTVGYLLKDTPRMMKSWHDLSTYTMKHELKPIVGHEFKFEEMPDAHRLMESRNSHGKIVVHI